MEPPDKKTVQPDLAGALERLWARFLPEIRERVSVLEGAARSLSNGRLTAEQRDAAGSAAHKLAGVLGTFNLSRGTVLARQLELVFSGAEDIEPESAARLAAMAAELRSVIDSRN